MKVESLKCIYANYFVCFNTNIKSGITFSARIFRKLGWGTAMPMRSSRGRVWVYMRRLICFEFSLKCIHVSLWSYPICLHLYVKLIIIHIQIWANKKTEKCGAFLPIRLRQQKILQKRQYFPSKLYRNVSAPHTWVGVLRKRRSNDDNTHCNIIFKLYNKKEYRTKKIWLSVCLNIVKNREQNRNLCTGFQI